MPWGPKGPKVYWGALSTAELIKLKETLLQYIVLVPLLREYCMQFGATQYNGIKITQYDQGRAKKMVKGLDGMTYEEQLRILCFFSLEKRRLKDNFCLQLPYDGEQRGMGQSFVADAW